MLRVMPPLGKYMITKYSSNSSISFALLPNSFLLCCHVLPEDSLLRLKGDGWLLNKIIFETVLGRFNVDDLGLEFSFLVEKTVEKVGEILRL